jgi:predicted small metal-binding protein
MANISGNNPTQNRPGSEGGGNLKSFRCADVADANCRWEVSGRDENELMPQIERHGREKHNITNFDEGTRQRVRAAIRTRSAA